VGHVLIVLALAAGYAVFLLVRPEKTCRWCSGWGARGKRRTYCQRCEGTGKRFRLGARFLHRAAVEGYRYVRYRKESRLR
jgi:DnaJ-class molecular chaperone